MIENNWAKAMAKANTSQATLSRRIGIPKSVLSMTCNGSYILPLDKLKECCSALGCNVADIYEPDMILAMYKEVVEKKPKKKMPVRVRIAPELSDEIDCMVSEGMFVDKTEAVNAIIRSACRDYRRICDGSTV